MTTNEVKARLLVYLDDDKDLASLRAWLLSVAQNASKHGEEVETLVGSVSYLMARLGAGFLPEPDFHNQLRMLASESNSPKLMAIGSQQSAAVGLGSFAIHSNLGNLSGLEYVAVGQAQFFPWEATFPDMPVAQADEQTSVPYGVMVLQELST